MSSLLPRVVCILFLLNGDHSQDGVGVLIVEGKVRNSIMLKNQAIILKDFFWELIMLIYVTEGTLH